MLAARGLTKRFGERTAVRDVSLDAAAGERVAIIGPNGAGKTTLLSLIAGTARPDAGEVGLPPREIGWVPQHTALYGKLSVAENLRLFARLEQVPDVDATVEAMLEQTRLRDRAGEELSKLSGGNRQRVNIAAGLLSAPKVLLLDEPSASLDPRQREVLWSWVADLAAGGTAVVFTTHEVGEAERWADRVVVLADGEVLFSGTPAALHAAEGSTPGDDFEAAFVRFLREKGH